MPNWKIPHHLRDVIKAHALALAQRPLDLALREFPLTVAQLQYHCSALTAEQVDTLRRLDSEGVRTIEHHRQLRLAFIRETIPALRRGVVVMLQLPEWIVVGKGTQWGIATTEFKPDENHYIVPQLTQLDTDSRRELVTWINRALRQVRLYEITNYMVEQALLNEHTPTTSHMHALWPTLTTMMNNNTHWQERFRNPTRSLKAYKPDADVKNKFEPLIRAADTMIAAGLMLPDSRPDRSRVQAQIEHWERIPGDPTFPLPE